MTQLEIRRLAKRVGSLLVGMAGVPDGCHVVFVVVDETSGGCTIGSARTERDTVELLGKIVENSREHLKRQRGARLS